MDRMKKRIIIVTVLILIGVWFGYNIGKGRTFYSNPFQSDEKVQLKEKAKDVIKDTKEVIRESLEEKPAN